MSPQLQEKSHEKETVFGGADCPDSSVGGGGQPDGSPGLQGVRHLGTDVVSLEEQVRSDGVAVGDGGLPGDRKALQENRRV
jgi:hypothetical protein